MKVVIASTAPGLWAMPAGAATVTPADAQDCVATAAIVRPHTRLTTFGLADIRGGVGLGFDEGSWLTAVMTAFVWHAMPRECINRALLQQTDWRARTCRDWARYDLCAARSG